MSKIFFLTSKTNVLTQSGYVSVSDIVPNDIIISNNAKLAPVTSISKEFEKSLITRWHDNRLPILFEVNSVCPGIPSRPLLIPADQQIHLNGLLFPADLLVNGRTIKRVEMPSLICRLLEIETDASIYVEGLPIGSHSDADNGEYDRSALRAVRTILIKRAGIQLSSDPLVSLRTTVHGIIIESRSGVPGDVTDDPTERRRLGIKLSSLRIRDREIPIDHPSLQLGWHEPEWDGRWTDGRALVPNDLLLGSQDIGLNIKATVGYPLDEDFVGNTGSVAYAVSRMTGFSGDTYDELF